jgi:hypothetical protein
MKSWFAIDGDLPALDHVGDTNCRYPEELVRIMLEEYTQPGDLILDPFCGFGTTLAVCSRMGRSAVGFEKSFDLFEYAQRFATSPNRLFHDRAENIAAYFLPQFDFLICSPPFRSFRNSYVADDKEYYADLRDIFWHLRPTLKANARIVVETVNLQVGPNLSIPRAFGTMLTLGDLFSFEREYVCCSTGSTVISPGCHHSYLMVFRNELGDESSGALVRSSTICPIEN